MGVCGALPAIYHLLCTLTHLQSPFRIVIAIRTRRKLQRKARGAQSTIAFNSHHCATFLCHSGSPGVHCAGRINISIPQRTRVAQLGQMPFKNT